MIERSESIKELATALAKAQGQMGFAVKDSTNPHFKSTYADLASAWGAARGPLASNGLCVTQEPVSATPGVVSMVTTIMHASGEWRSSTMTIPVSKADAQGYGSAITYLRRYSFMAVIGLAPDDDDGNAASKPRALSSAAAAKMIGNANIKPTSGAMESLTLEQQEFIKGKVVIAKEYLDMGDDLSAMALMSDFSCETEKVAAWTLFDSKQRSRLKLAAKDTATVVTGINKLEGAANG